MKYTFTPKELDEILRKCWEASADYKKQMDRINSGHYNFNEPINPNFEKFHTNTIKKLKGYDDNL